MGIAPAILSAVFPVAAILFLLTPLTTNANEQPKAVRLTYRETHDQSSPPADEAKMILMVGADRTTITQGEDVLLIDYRNLEVIRHHCRRSAAIHYPLRPARPVEKSPTIAEEMMVRLGSYRILSSRKGGTYHGMPVKETVIRFGMGLAQARTAAPMQYDFYGQRFGERTLHIEAADRVPHFAELVKQASGHREAVRANPLLLQLDPINLIPLVGGLPLVLRDQSGKRLEFVELQLVEDG